MIVVMTTVTKGEVKGKGDTWQISVLYHMRDVCSMLNQKIDSEEM